MRFLGQIKLSEVKLRKLATKKKEVDLVSNKGVGKVLGLVWLHYWCIVM